MEKMAKFAPASLLGLACLGTALATWLVLENPLWERATGTEDKTGQAGRKAGRSALTRAPRQPSESAYRIIIERPLFNAERRPAQSRLSEGPVETPTQTNVPGGYKLLGVIVEAGTRSALIQIAGSPRPTVVAEGGSIDGWRLAEVRDDAVVLERGSSTQELNMVRIAEPRVRSTRSTSPKTTKRRRMQRIKQSVEEVREDDQTQAVPEDPDDVIPPEDMD